MFLRDYFRIIKIRKGLPFKIALGIIDKELEIIIENNISHFIRRNMSRAF